MGERYDGYMGFVGNPSPELRRQVSAINLRRRNLYIELADAAECDGPTRRNGDRLPAPLAARPGEAYQLSDGVWRRYAAGQKVALPNYCR